MKKTQFTLIARQIGRDISETAEKLDRLTKLAKKKSLFDDSTYEIQELTTIINQDIQNVNNQLSVLQQRSNNAKSKQATSHTDTVVNTLKSKLKSTTKEFTEVLELRTETLKVQQKERENFTGNQSPIFPSGKRHVESPLYKPQQSYSESAGGGEVAISMPSSSSMMVLSQDRYTFPIEVKQWQT